VPQEFRILCSWDVRQKLTVRPFSGFESIGHVSFEFVWDDAWHVFESDFGAFRVVVLGFFEVLNHIE
jgi:hypothetical protein